MTTISKIIKDSVDSISTVMKLVDHTVRTLEKELEEEFRKLTELINWERDYSLPRYWIEGPYEEDNKYVYYIVVELPGIESERDLKVEREKDLNMLIIEAHRKIGGEAKYRLKIPLPANAADIKAMYKNGVLVIRVERPRNVEKIVVEFK